MNSRTLYLLSKRIQNGEYLPRVVTIEYKDTQSSYTQVINEASSPLERKIYDYERKK